MLMNVSMVTERGQVSIPSELRKTMGLRAGQRLHWEQISDCEMRVSIRDEDPPGPMSVLGYAREIRSGPARPTRDWMRELREGE